MSTALARTRSHPGKYASGKSKMTTTKVKQIIVNSLEKKQKVTKFPDEFDSVTTAWSEVDLLDLEEGEQSDQRIGKSVSITSIEMIAVVSGGQVNGATDDTRDTMRVVIGLYHGGAVTPLTTAGAALDSPIKPYLFTRATLIRKYLDKFVTLDTNGADSTGYLPVQKTLKFYKKFKKPIKITWGTDPDDYPSKKLIMSCLSDSAGVPNPGFVHGYIMVRYIDA